MTEKPTTNLYRVTTADGLNLTGVLSVPGSEIAADLPIDAFLLVHGTASNFYAGGVLWRFAELAVAGGTPVLRINTRGHDMINTISSSSGPVRCGAAYEVIADCVHDLRAWIDQLVGDGFERIALVGHSMGGVKCVYTQANAPHPNVTHVVAVSSPRFCHDSFMKHSGADAFRRDYARAVQLVADGRDSEVMRVTQPMPMLLTAAGFVAKYGPHDDYNIVRHLPGIRVPTLYIVGTESVRTSPAFDGVPDEILTVADTNPNVSLSVVEGTNTVYSGVTDVPFRRTHAWLTGDSA